MSFTPTDFTVPGSQLTATEMTRHSNGIQAAASTADSALAASGSASSGVPGGVSLDSFTGSTDDAKLVAATNSLRTALPRKSRLVIPGDRTFSSTIADFSGRRIKGAAGPGPHNIEPNNNAGEYVPQVLNINAGNGTSSWFSSATSVQSVVFEEMAMLGGSAGNTQFWNLSGGSGVYPGTIRDCTWIRFKTVLGSLAQKALITRLIWEGHCTILQSFDTPIHVGGSDAELECKLNLQGSGATAGGGKYLAWFDTMQKSSVANWYITCVNGWRGIRVSGSLLSASGLVFDKMKIEGANTGNPNVGACVLLEGGGTTWRDIWLAWSMTSSTFPVTNAATGISERGVFHVTGGDHIIDGIRYEYGTTTAPTATTPFGYTGANGTAIPLVYCSAGTVEIRGVRTTTGVKPFAVQTGTGTVTSPDNSVNILTV